jgi:tyrosyl-tRNA synthetase
MSKINTNPEDIDKFLHRGVISQVLPTIKEFKELLLSGKKLKAYWGFDPTSTALHLSHAKNIILLEEFRKLGHEVHVLFGDFTARIGDPTDKSATRSQLTQEDVQTNVQAWVEHIRPLMDFDAKENAPKIVYNADWLKDMKLEQVLEAAANFTVQQMLERDMFDKRIKEGKPIHLHEFLYPLMQGYDSVAQDVDVEFCGTDQTFNALAGRVLQKRYNNKEKLVVAVNLMEDPVTGTLMSKSNGTGVFLGTTPEEMYGQVMAQNDSMIKPLLVNLTRIPLEEIDALNIEKDPMSAKKFTAEKIVEIFHNTEIAQKAGENWATTFQKQEIPEDIKKVTVKLKVPLVEILIQQGLVKSKSDFRRLINEGAIKFHGEMREEKILDPEALAEESGALKIGKRRFLKIVVEKKEKN